VPAVSIGMPVYNGEQTLEAAVQSILAQTFSDFELILSDNASTDGSLALAQRLARLESRIRVVANARNRGAFYNYRRVFLESRGRLFKWASCSDLCAPRHLERCVAALERHPDSALAYTRTLLFSDDPKNGIPYEESFQLQSESPYARFRSVLDNIRLNNFYNGVFRRSALERVPLAGDYMSSDIVQLAELALVGKFIEVPEYDYFRRMDNASATALMKGEQLHHHLLGSKNTPRMQGWRAMAVIFTIPLRHWIPLRDRARLAAYTLRRAYWSVPALAAELKDVIVRPASQ
jgi:glycosyltransferase involved in cell wall biosynthesis